MALRYSPVAIADATTYAVKDYNSGLVHMVPDVTSSITITLPTAAAGLQYEFWYAGAAADAQDCIIKTGSNANYFKGGVVFLDVDSDVIGTVFSDGNSNSILTLVTPACGTRISVWCDGTVWYLNGSVASNTIPTLGDA